jgi:CHAT domain-containing protein
MARRSHLALALLGATAIAAPATTAAEPAISTRNSFRIGTEGVLCSAQLRVTDPRIVGMFDRAYRLTCRDAAAPVGMLLALRHPADLHRTVEGQLCGTQAAERIEGIGAVRSVGCRDPQQQLDYRRYSLRRGSTHYLVEGLAGYDSVLRLALASIVNDRTQAGAIRIATTMVSDPAAFARIQAGALESSGARIEGYNRNNGGAFAESAEFFTALAQRDTADPITLAEALVNQGLQQSNLGNHAAAVTLFDQAAQQISSNDPVLRRLLRNYRALAELNRDAPDQALLQLATAVPEIEKASERDALRTGVISEPISFELNSESDEARQLRAMDSALTAAERAEILDAQAQALTGTALRQQAKFAEASAALSAAASRIRKVRNGRVVSAAWLLADIAMDQGLVAEARGDRAKAVAGFDTAIAGIASNYPQSPALLSARARKAGLLVRLGDKDAAASLFSKVVTDSADVPDGGATLRGLLGPYFSLLAERGTPQSADAMFLAAQARQRPGVAQTQAVLARQFSAGSDEAAALFRLSVSRSREIARAEQEVTERRANRSSPEDRTRLASAERNLAALQEEQTGLQSRLAAYPRYLALSRANVSLDELQRQLRPGEAYWQLIDSAAGVFGLLATATSARTYRAAIDRAEFATSVAAIRTSIARVDGGEVVTDPFDLARAHDLYTKLMGPIAGELGSVRHLIVEPDGPLLQLPLSVLVTDAASVSRYRAAQAQPGADEFDFRGVAWLGRDRQISTAVSPRSFLDVRAVPASRASQVYLGLGGNAVPESRPVAAVAGACDWPLAAWQAPIATDELKLAEQLFGAERSQLVTGAAFSDTELLRDGKLDNYRIVHFATHGLVTAPRPDCPPRPALLTSFGPGSSDGLLSFREIFDLKLDADVVILSACDTAGLATVGASREAGVSGGGNYALDGLVRAFVGAGARSVVASHWPVPDDYGATRRLMSGLLGGAAGAPLGASLAAAQRALMDDKQTSHPFYWAAFIILGDGARPLLPVDLAAPVRKAAVAKR